MDQVKSDLVMDEWVYDSFKKVYETSLKANMVAMLTEIEDKIKHCDINGLWKPNYKEGFNDGVAKCCSIIHQEIDTLKAESEVENGND